MLQLPAVLSRPGWSVYTDDERPGVCHVLPTQVRLRRTPGGPAVLSLAKYRAAPGGPSGGILDLQTELALTPAELDEALTAARAHPALVGVQPAPAQPLWIDGAAELFVQNPGASPAVQVVTAQPALTGTNPASFQAALTPEAATLLWGQLHDGGRPLQAAYRLRVMARLPAGQIRAHLRADTSPAAGAKTTAEARDALVAAGAAGVDVLDWPPGGDPALREQLTAWGWDWLTPWLPPHGTAPTADIDAVFTASNGLPWPITAGGSLDPLDLAADLGCLREIDLTRPVIERAQVSVRCNAPFETGRIAAITAHLEYGDQRHAAVFTRDDMVETFAVTVDPALGREITVRPVITFAASSRTLELPARRTDRAHVLISVDHTGWLTLDLSTPEIDWSTVRHVEAGLRYGDAEHGVPQLEDVLLLDEAHPAMRYERAVYAPQTRPVELRLAYQLADGRRIERDWTPLSDDSVLVPAPFDRWLDLTLRAAAVFGTISGFVVDLEAEDGTGRTAHQTVRLGPGAETARWRIGTVKPATGEFRYRVTTLRADGGSAVADWQTGHSSQTLDVGPRPTAFLEVTVVADLIDFTTVKLVRTVLGHRAADGQAFTHDMGFAAGQPTSATWRLPLTDAQPDGNVAYTVSSTFYLADGTRRRTPETTGTDPVVVLQLPQS